MFSERLDLSRWYLGHSVKACSSVSKTGCSEKGSSARPSKMFKSEQKRQAFFSLFSLNFVQRFLNEQVMAN